MKTTYRIWSDGAPGTAGITGEPRDARSALRSTMPLLARVSAVIRASSASDGTSSTESEPFMPRYGLFGRWLPAFGPLPNPRKQMQARRFPSGLIVTRYGYHAVGICPSSFPLRASTTPRAFSPDSATYSRDPSGETTMPDGPTPRSPATSGDGDRRVRITILPLFRSIRSTVSLLPFET